VVHQALPCTVKRLNVLLFDSSLRHQWDVRLAHRRTNRLGIVPVVLLSVRRQKS
jgi:hypothetical protein